MTTKTCRACEVEKDWGDFHLNAASKDGLCASCKECSRLREAINKRQLGLSRCDLSARVSNHSRKNRRHHNQVAELGEAVVEVLDAHQPDWEERAKVGQMMDLE